MSSFVVASPALPPNADPAAPPSAFGRRAVAVEEESHCGGAAERKSFRHNLQDSTAVTVTRDSAA
jgi:hypothetical protein